MTPQERDALSPRAMAVWAAVYAREWSCGTASTYAAIVADDCVASLHAHEHPTEEEKS
jgi:hypothetical protein